MKKKVAFVLGGGGARGALQVGALRALLEAGYRPDFLVGTSIGAVNAAFLAIHGLSLNTIEKLVQAWRDAAKAELLPANYLWLTVRILFNHPSPNYSHRMRTFFIDHGMKPELSFRDIKDMQLFVVSADLNSGAQVLYGLDPNQSVLEAVLASTALPPWMPPMEVRDKLLVDGGTVSTLPVEAALARGATEIFALDLHDSRIVASTHHNFGFFLGKFLHTVEQRQVELELALARAHQVRVHHMQLFTEYPVQVWDFSHTQALIERGYELTRQEIQQLPTHKLPEWLNIFDRIRKSYRQRGLAQPERFS